MGEPIVYISHWRVREGKYEDYRRHHDRLARIVEDEEPSVAAFLAFADDDGRVVTTIHVFPDAATLENHMRVLADKLALVAPDISEVLQYLEPVGIDVYGAPGESAAQMDRSLAEQGLSFTATRRFVGGFTATGPKAGQ